MSAGREVVTAPFNLMGSAGGWAVRALTGEQGSKISQRHLRQYVGRLMVIGDLPDETPAAQMDKAARWMALLLHNEGFLKPHKTIGIQAMVPDTEDREPRHLLQTATTLGQTLTEHYGMLPVVHPEPFRSGRQPSDSGSVAVHLALHEALNNFERQVGYHDRQASPSFLNFVVVTDSRYAIRSLLPANFGEMVNGGAAELKSVGQQPEDNFWVAYGP